MAPAPREQPRLDSLRLAGSRDFLASASPGPPLVLKRRLVGSLDLKTAHHTAKVVPAGKYDLTNMNEKEPNKAHRDPEMLPTRHLVTTENRSDPVSLRGLVDRDTRDEHAEPHRNNAGVCDPLCPVIFCLRRQPLAEMKVHQGHLDGVLKTALFRN